MPRTTKQTKNINISIGEIIRNRRMSLGISRKILADKLGISYQQVHKYEKGENRISACKLPILSSALEMKIEELFDIVNLAPPSKKQKAILELTKNLYTLDENMIYAFSQHTRNIKTALNAIKTA